jgi:hypothetical protein
MERPSMTSHMTARSTSRLPGQAKNGPTRAEAHSCRHQGKACSVGLCHGPSASRSHGGAVLKVLSAGAGFFCQLGLAVGARQLSPSPACPPDQRAVAAGRPVRPRPARFPRRPSSEPGCAYRARTSLPPEGGLCGASLQAKNARFAGTFHEAQVGAACWGGLLIPSRRFDSCPAYPRSARKEAGSRIGHVP